MIKKVCLSILGFLLAIHLVKVITHDYDRATKYFVKIEYTEDKTGQKINYQSDIISTIKPYLQIKVIPNQRKIVELVYKDPLWHYELISAFPDSCGLIKSDINLTIIKK